MLAAISYALEERDPRDLHIIRAFPQLTMDRLESTPAIFPAVNLFAWKAPYPDRRLRVEPLDPLQRGADTLRPAPILSHDRKAAEVELIDERHEIGDVMREG